MGFRAMRLSGELTPALKGEWEASCRRRAQHLLTFSERAAVINALKTRAEVHTHIKRRKGLSSPSPACYADVDSFFQYRTSAPARAMASLKCLVKQSKLPLDLGDPALGEAAQAGESAWQAAVAEPPMLPMLEDMIVSKYRANDPVWSALLGWWLTATGVLCYAHVMRSWPRRLSHSTFHGQCSRGKQRQNRQGLDFCIPAVFACSWPWGQIGRGMPFPCAPSTKSLSLPMPYRPLMPGR